EATDESDETERNDGLDVHRPPSKREISRLSKYLRDNSSDLTDDFILGIHMATAAGSIPGVIGLCDAMEVFAEQHPKYVKDELTRALAWAAGKRQARTIAGLTKTLAASRKRGKSEPAT
ncbi:MAG: hypothetical protein ABI862_07870, partial [Ilumatobacteraceae bacterium]